MSVGLAVQDFIGSEKVSFYGVVVIGRGNQSASEKVKYQTILIKLNFRFDWSELSELNS